MGEAYQAVQGSNISTMSTSLCSLSGDISTLTTTTSSGSGIFVEDAQVGSFDGVFLNDSGPDGGSAQLTVYAGRLFLAGVLVGPPV